MITKIFLKKEYLKKQRSVSEIAAELHCSQNKVNYWIKRHGIAKRSRSQAMYVKHNNCGDPFSFRRPITSEEWFLYGVGLGLFWGEGNKANHQAVRLGNTDPDVVRTFLDFLRTIYNIDESRLRFGLQLFSDIDQETALSFWSEKLRVPRTQFQKVVYTKSVQNGTYRKKCPYGVLTVYFSNTKLRANIGSAITALQTNSYANVAQSVERIHGKSQ